MISRTRIKGGIGVSEVKGVRKAHSTVGDHTNVSAKLKIMASANPGEIISDVMHRGYSFQIVRFIVGLENEPKRHVVASTVPTFGERLPGVAVAQAIHPL